MNLNISEGIFIFPDGIKTRLEDWAQSSVSENIISSGIRTTFVPRAMSNWASSKKHSYTITEDIDDIMYIGVFHHQSCFLTTYNVMDMKVGDTITKEKKSGIVTYEHKCTKNQNSITCSIDPDYTVTMVCDLHIIRRSTQHENLITEDAKKFLSSHKLSSDGINVTKENFPKEFLILKDNATLPPFISESDKIEVYKYGNTPRIFLKKGKCTVNGVSWQFTIGRLKLLTSDSEVILKYYDYNNTELFQENIGEVRRLIFWYTGCGGYGSDGDIGFLAGICGAGGGGGTAVLGTIDIKKFSNKEIMEIEIPATSFLSSGGIISNGKFILSGGNGKHSSGVNSPGVATEATYTDVSNEDFDIIFKFQCPGSNGVKRDTRPTTCSGSYDLTNIIIGGKIENYNNTAPSLKWAGAGGSSIWGPGKAGPGGSHGFGLAESSNVVGGGGCGGSVYYPQTQSGGAGGPGEFKLFY